MTASAADYSKKPITIVDLMPDACAHTYAQGACTATRSATGLQCFNTYDTCKDKANYSATTTTIRLLEVGAPEIKNVTGRRCIVKVKRSPGKIDFTRGLASNDRITIKCIDEDDDDVGVDPYYAQRLGTASTFFRKFKKRNLAIVNRVMWIRHGYLEPDGTLDVSAMTSQQYLIQSIEPIPGRHVNITAKDILVKLSTVKIPTATNASLGANLAAAAVTATLTGSYSSLPAANFYLWIDKEIMKIGARVGAALAGITRAQGGTADVAHDIDTRVQETWHATGAPEELWRDIQTKAGIDLGDIDFAGAQAEVAELLENWSLEAFIKPTLASTLMVDLCRQCRMHTWWDADTQKSKLSILRPRWPGETITKLNDTAHLIGKENIPAVQEQLRLTRVFIYFGVRDWSKSIKKQDMDTPNFSTVEANINATAESSIRYGDERMLEIFAYFLPADHKAKLEAMAWRLINRRVDPPANIPISLEAKDADAIKVGAIAELITPELIDIYGQPLATETIIIGKTPPEAGGIVTGFLAQETKQAGRWWFWAPDDILAGDYTEEDKDTYAWWAQADGKLPDGSDGYMWI